jgi:hypothetical protein
MSQSPTENALLDLLLDFGGGDEFEREVLVTRQKPRKKRAVLWRADYKEIARVFMSTPFDQDFLDGFKVLVPPGNRSWNNRTKMPPQVWHFDPIYLEQVYALLVSHSFEVTILDKVVPTQATISGGKPVQSAEELRAELRLTDLGRRKIDL